MLEYTKYVGLDTHKKSIAVAIADREGGLRYYGSIENTPTAITKLIQQLSPNGEVINFCYEAGPCGYGLYRDITRVGHVCHVVAPSLIPKRSGDRIKTDRRDALNLARLHRSNELTSVWVPNKAQEAMRDLTRARIDFKNREKQCRLQLGGFLLRHHKIYPGKTRWSKAHWRWLSEQKFDSPIQQIVFQEYLDAIEAAQTRVVALVKEMEGALEGYALKEVVTGLMALRGVDFITALSVVAELGDLTRFESPRQLMAYVGLTPSEHSSGDRRRQGAITKTGNTQARRLLVESAWSYRFPARKTAHLQKRAREASPAVQAIAWKAQKRLCQRYQDLITKGKLTPQACVAVARELVGFIWAVAREIQGKTLTTPSS